jgi:hypothetical protein
VTVFSQTHIYLGVLQPRAQIQTHYPTKSARNRRAIHRPPHQHQETTQNSPPIRTEIRAGKGRRYPSRKQKGCVPTRTAPSWNGTRAQSAAVCKDGGPARKTIQWIVFSPELASTLASAGGGSFGGGCGTRASLWVVRVSLHTTASYRLSNAFASKLLSAKSGPPSSLIMPS